MNEEWEKKLINIISSPFDGLICVEGKTEMSETVDKEKQQDFYILQNQQELSTFMGELVGKSGNGGTIGELKSSTSILNERIVSLQNLFHSLEKQVQIQNTEEKNKTKVIEREIEKINKRLSILEKEGGKRVISLLSFIVMTVIIISYQILSK